MFTYQFAFTNGTKEMSFEELQAKFAITGWNENNKQREELQDQPKVKGFYGPMYNGKKDGKTVIRYETKEVYDDYFNN